MPFARLKDAAAAFERAVSGELQYAVAHKTLGIVYDPETGAWSRYLTGDSKPQDTVGLVEESGTWATGRSFVGRP